MLKWEGSFESLKGGCKQYVADNGLEIRWYSSSKSLCFNGPNSENLKLQLINLIPKEQTIDGVEGEILPLNNEDEPTNITEDEHSDVDNDKDLNADSVEHSGELFSMNAKVNELSHKISKLKSKSVCNHDLSH